MHMQSLTLKIGNFECEIENRYKLIGDLFVFYHCSKWSQANAMPMCNLSLNWSVQIRSTDQSLRARGLEKVFHFSPRMLQKHAALWQTSFQLIFNFAENSADDFNFHTSGVNAMWESHAVTVASSSVTLKLTSLFFSLSTRLFSSCHVYCTCLTIWLVLLSFEWCDSGC